MPKHLCKIVAIIFILATNNLNAQIMRTFPKIIIYSSVWQYLNELKYFAANKTSSRDSAKLVVDSASQLQQMIDNKLSNMVIGVNIFTERRPNLDEIFDILAQFPNLHELQITDRAVVFDTDKPYNLPVRLSLLTQLKSIGFAYTNKLDMDSVSRLLTTMSNIQSFSIYGYHHQLPPTIFKLKQIKRIGLTTENIGNNDLQGTNWEDLTLYGDSYKIGQSGYKITVTHDVKAIKALQKVNTLKSLSLDIYEPSDSLDIASLKQLTELKFTAFKSGEKLLPQIGKLTKLQTLSLDIHAYNLSLDTLKYLTQIRSLQLQFHAYEKNPPLKGVKAISNFKNLERLDINNAILDLPDNFFDAMSQLKHVELNNDELKKVPISLFNLPNLIHLDIHANHIQALPDVEKYFCNNLDSLWIDNNALTSLPAALTNLPKLEILSATANDIKTTAGNFANLKKLNQIDLSYNDLKNYPVGLENNHNVEKIILRDNKINEIGDPEHGDYRLKTLILTYNPVAILPVNIGRYRKLQYFDLNGAKLSEIPKTFGNCDSLKYLNLTGSVISKTALPQSLKKLKKLEALGLSYDPLIDHQSMFDFIFSAKKPLSIGLAFDNITELPATTQWGKSSIVFIDLSGNPLTTLPFEFAQTKATVNLFHNKLNGDSIIFNIARNRAQFKIWFDELKKPLTNYPVSNADYSKALMTYIPDLYQTHKWSRVVEFADKAKAADSAFYKNHISYQIGMSRFRMGDYKQAIIDLSYPSFNDFTTREYKAKSFIALGQLDSAAVTYAKANTLLGLIRADSVCKISGNTTLLIKLNDSLGKNYENRMDYWANHDYYNAHEMVFSPKGTYPDRLILEYATYLLLNNKPQQAAITLNYKKFLYTISSYQAIKAFLLAAANYLINPSSFDNGKASITKAIAKNGKIYRDQYIPVLTDLFPYANYTADQKEHLIALQQTLYKN